jgi:Skp family chaperone for outer membrane proteins
MTKVLITAAVCAAAAVVIAQSPAPSGATRPSPRLAVVDLERISRESLLGKSYQARLQAAGAQLESEQTKKKAELQKRETELRALTADLERQAAALSEEAGEKRRQEIVRKTRERDAFVEDGRAELARLQQKAEEQMRTLNDDFQKRIVPQIHAAGRAQGFDLLLLANQAVITLNQTYDISSDIIVKLDDAERALAKPAKSAKP